MTLSNDIDSLINLWLFLPQSHDRGWLKNRGLDSQNRQLVRLRRASTTAEEGVFTCNITGDTNTPRYLGVYYSSELCVISRSCTFYVYRPAVYSHTLCLNLRCDLCK